jgi:hypothetical protein
VGWQFEQRKLARLSLNPISACGGSATRRLTSLLALVSFSKVVGDVILHLMVGGTHSHSQ